MQLNILITAAVPALLLASVYVVREVIKSSAEKGMQYRFDKVSRNFVPN